jgi:hypothetical protein
VSNQQHGDETNEFIERKLSYRRAFKGIGGTECDTVEP